MLSPTKPFLRLALSLFLLAPFQAQADALQPIRDTVMEERISEARKLAEELAGKPGAMPETQLLLAEILLYQGETKAAEDILNQFSEEGPQGSQRTYLSAASAFRNQQVEVARAALEKLTAANPKEARFQAAFGLVLAHLGEEASALGASKKAESLNPGETIFLVNTGLAYSRFGKREEAEKTLTDAANSSFPPTFETVSFEKLWSLQDRYDEEVKRYSVLQLKNSNDTSLSAYVAFLNFLAGHLDIAASLYERILENDPGHAKAAYRLGGIRLLKGQLPVAKKLFRTAAEKEPANPKYRRMYGVTTGLAGDLNQAVALLGETTVLDPKDAEAWCNMGVFEAYRDHFSAAKECYIKALTLRPAYVDAHVNLGLILGQEGKEDEAIKHFQEALALDPGHAKAHKFLGITLFSQEKYQEALEAFRAAADRDPRDGEVLLRGLMTAKKLDDSAEAISWVRKALAVDPGDPAVRLELVKMLKESGNKTAAQAELDALLDLDPANAEALALQKELGAGAAGPSEGVCYCVDASRSTLETVATLVKGGKSLEAAAKLEGVLYLSTEVAAGALLPEVEGALKQLSGEALSPVIETSRGYFLVRRCAAKK